MRYLKKAHPAIREYAKNNKEFAKAYETDKLFREWCYILTVAPKEMRQEVIEFLEQELDKQKEERAKGQATK